VYQGLASARRKFGEAESASAVHLLVFVTDSDDGAADMLKALGAGAAAKIVVPLEVTGLLAGIGERIAAAGDVGKATLLDACVGPR